MVRCSTNKKAMSSTMVYDTTDICPKFLSTAIRNQVKTFLCRENYVEIVFNKGL